MSESESTPSQSNQSTATSSVGRILKVVAPCAVVLVAGAWALQTYLPSVAQQELEERRLEHLLGSKAAKPETVIEFVDSDNDLLADFPPDEKCITPEKLVFAFVPSSDPGDEEATWRPLLEAIAEATGMPTETKHYEKVRDQVAALASGELHITAVNTGSVSQAVEYGGFIPTSTTGADGQYGYTMDFLIRAGSDIQTIGDLKGRKITFVRPNSNSGFKAALVVLMNDHDLLPERDYDFTFSMAHENSVRNLLDGKTDAAPVASDLFDRMVANGEVDPKAIRILYQSERFPPVAFGYSHQLAPELREKIADLLVNFDWSGTPLEEAYKSSGSTGFAPISYKDDWANIRRVDDTIEQARQRRQ